MTNDPLGADLPHATGSASHEAELPPEAMQLAGSIDDADANGNLIGWACDRRRPEIRRRLLLYADDVVVAEVVADVMRGDLAAAGVGDGSHGFVIRTPPHALRSDRATTLVVRDAETGQQIGSDQAAGPLARPLINAKLVATSGIAGNLDQVTRDGWVTGWCWRPSDPAHRVELAILVDDEIVGTTIAGTFRQDLLDGGHGDGAYGFSFALPWSTLAYKGTMTIAVRDVATGDPLGEAVTLRTGADAASEDRILDLERQIRMLRDEVAALTRQSDGHDEDRAARDLFRTVGAFFQELADSPDEAAFTGAGIRGALSAFLETHPPITLARPVQPAATIVVEAKAPAALLYRCIAAIHEIGADDRADIVLLDDGGFGGEGALLPAAVRNLRYRRVATGTSRVAARNEAADDTRAPIVIFCAGDCLPRRGWLDALLATFDDEPKAAIVGGRVSNRDDVLDDAGFAVGEDLLPRPRAVGAFAALPELSFMRRVDAVADDCFAMRRDDAALLGGFAEGFATTTMALLDACLAARASGRTVLFQPQAAVTRNENVVEALPDPSDVKLLRQRWPAPAIPKSSGFVGHALVVDSGMPRPDRDAGSVATLEQMLVLRDLGWRVAFAPADGIFDEAGVALLQRRGIEVARPPRYDSISTYLQRNSATLQLVHVHRYAHATMLFERARALTPQARLVFAPVDLHFLREQREAKVAGRAWNGTQARAEELACVRAADATLLYSDHEMALLSGEVAKEKLHLLRWIVRPVAAAAPFDQRRDLCFVGSFRHPPNGDAVIWFVAEVMPLIRRTLPGVALHVVGGDAPPAIRDLAASDVIIHGWVEDLAALLDAMRLSVAPLRFGAGFKGKVATSLSRGLPVVGTTISVEGTGLENGDGISVADGPIAFAEAIGALYDNAEQWQEQSRRAIERCAELYSPDRARALWRDLLEGLGLPATGP